jgi:predicted PurR-regulated permease PerM
MFFIAMSILRLPYPLLIGVLIAFAALIPLVGTFIGVVIGTFLILMVDPMQALIFLIMYIVLQQLESSFVFPKVVGGSIGLPSIWVLAAVSIGGTLMGILGMLLFIPIASVSYSLFRDYVHKRLEKKGITIDESNLLRFDTRKGESLITKSIKKIREKIKDRKQKDD